MNTSLQMNICKEIQNEREREKKTTQGIYHQEKHYVKVVFCADAFGITYAAKLTVI